MRTFFKLLQRAEGLMYDENYTLPNMLAKLNATKIYLDIYNNYEFEPNYVGYNADGAICLTYNYYSTNKKSFNLIIETYNDGESAVVISDRIRSEIVYLEDVYDLNFEKAIKLYKKFIGE